MVVTQKLLGQKDKQDIFSYTLKNNFLTIVIFNYGGIIQKIIMPDKNNQNSNVVLSYPQVKDYYSNPAYLGATIGRVAGRIPRGIIEFQGKKIFLNKNEKVGEKFSTTLHGGKKGFEQKISRGKIYQQKDKVGVQLTFTSEDGEEGFPGDLEIISDYSLNAENVFSIRHTSSIKEPTLLNLTQHTYFNLSGKKENVFQNHYLKIIADEILAMDDNQCLQPKSLKVGKTPFDFREEKKIPLTSIKENTSLNKFRGYDHYFLFSNDKKGGERKNKPGKVTLYHAESGRKITMLTNQKGMIFYTGNYLNIIKKFQRYQGLCLEVQDYPYFLSEKIPPGFPFSQKIYLPGESYSHETEYHFSIEK